MSFAAVAAGTAGLLVISFDALRDVVVYHEAHVALVDTHAEGDGGHDDIHLLHEELVLVLGPHLVVKSGMVGEGFDAVDDQQLRQVFHLLAREAVDDAALAGIFLDIAYNLLVQLHRVARLGTHLVVEVGAVEARDEGVGLLHAEVFDDILLHLGGGRSGEGQDRHLGVDGGDGVAQAAVFGTEVVAPFRDAVGLVDGEERDGDLLQELHRLGFREGLRCHIEQFRATLQEVFLHLVGLHPREGGVEEVGHAVAARSIAHRVHLVLHQCNQGRDHDGRPFRNHRRKLVAEALAATRGHDDEGVEPVEQTAYDSLLVALEVVESEYFFQAGMQIYHSVNNISFKASLIVLQRYEKTLNRQNIFRQKVAFLSRTA